jgi:hypothetical protein
MAAAQPVGSGGPQPASAAAAAAAGGASNLEALAGAVRQAATVKRFGSGSYSPPSVTVPAVGGGAGGRTAAAGAYPGPGQRQPPAAPSADGQRNMLLTAVALAVLSFTLTWFAFEFLKDRGAGGKNPGDGPGTADPVDREAAERQKKREQEAERQLEAVRNLPKTMPIVDQIEEYRNRVLKDYADTPAGKKAKEAVDKLFESLERERIADRELKALLERLPKEKSDDDRIRKLQKFRTDHPDTGAAERASEKILEIGRKS